MSPIKLSVKGLAGCILVPRGNPYRLKDGTQTSKVAITVSLLHAEPSLRRLSEGTPIDCEEAVAAGYRLVRNYDDAVTHGLA
jgi:hypothetical protein